MTPELKTLKREIIERGSIGADDVQTLRRAIFGPGSTAGTGVSKSEAELLFELNQATDANSNHSSWFELFVEAIKRHVLEDEQSPGLVDPSEARWLMRQVENDGRIDAGERSLLWSIRHDLHHSEVWGGIHGGDLEANTSCLKAHLYCRPCESGKGGDIYYFSVSASEMLTRIALADVCGHGQPVSDISHWIYEAMSNRMNAAEGSAVLAELNRLTADSGYRAMTTAAVVTFDRTDWHLDYSYAGHPPIYLRRHSASQWEAILLDDDQRVANLPLGVLPEAEYEQDRLPLAPGDRLLLYTDGVIEAPNATGELFGINRVLETMEARAGDDPKTLKDALLAALWKHTGGKMSHDDVTFMVVELAADHS